MKVLNLYAGIGGNRKFWTDCEVTAVELNPKIATIYADLYPNDTVVIGDAPPIPYNTIDKVTGSRLANDSNRYLIALWQHLQQGHQFQLELSKEIYDNARQQYYDKDAGKDGMYWGDADIGWVGFMASANGRFFEGGYSGKSNTKIGTVRDYISESIRNVNRQIPNLKDVVFSHGDYKQ